MTEAERRDPQAAQDEQRSQLHVDRAVLEKWIGETRKHAESRRAWYDGRARNMGKMSRRLRLSAVILAVLGGLCPLVPEKLVEKFFGSEGTAAVSQFGFVLFALAGAAVLLDQAFGYSSSWMRSRLAELELSRLIRSYGMELDAALASQATSITSDEANRIVSRLAKFAADVENIVVLET